MIEWRYVRDLVRHPVLLQQARSYVLLLPTPVLRDLARSGEYGDRALARGALRRTPWAWV